MLRTALSRCARQALGQVVHSRDATALATLAACQPALLGQAAFVRGAAHAHAAPRLAAPLARSFAAEPARLTDEAEPHYATQDHGTPAAKVCVHNCGACAGCGASSATAGPSAPTSGGQTYDAGYIAPHAGIQQASPATDSDYLLMHPVYTREYVESVSPRHRVPTKLHEHIGFRAIQVLRGTFDVATGYGPNNMTEAKWLQRMIFLETVAGVPGMVAGMLRHLKSLRTMTRDNGWIHTLLEEAENERMHLLTFLKIRQPGLLFRTMVLLGQGMFFNFYMLAYIVSPKTCHSMVGYLEEEAVKTYTHALHDIGAGKLWANTPAPDIAINYWRLPEGATMRDLILAVRADEAAHSHVNHTFSAMKPADTNPFAVGQHAVP